MSLILDALKKTQSALNPHEAYTRAETTPKEEPKPHSQSQHPHIPLGFQKNTMNVMQFFNRWTIGLCSTGLLIAVLFVGHHFFSDVFKRYTGFYGELTHAFSRSLSTTPTHQSTILPPIPNLQLEGTVQVNGAHLALINQTMYHAGQFIGDFEITQVKYDSVTLLDRKTHQVIHLVPTLTQ